MTVCVVNEWQAESVMTVSVENEQQSESVMTMGVENELQTESVMTLWSINYNPCHDSLTTVCGGHASYKWKVS